MLHLVVLSMSFNQSLFSFTSVLSSPKIGILISYTNLPTGLWTINLRIEVITQSLSTTQNICYIVASTEVYRYSYKRNQFCFVLSSLRLCHVASLFTSDERKVCFLTYLTLLTNMPALLMTSLIQTAGFKMAALNGVVSRFWNVDFFYQRGPEIGWKIAMCLN